MLQSVESIFRQFATEYLGEFEIFFIYEYHLREKRLFV
jgi:hypothetical protein